MPPKKAKKKADKDDVMVKLEKFDIEDFHPDSAANVKIEDTLVPKIFDWIPDDLDRKKVSKFFILTHTPKLVFVDT